MEFEEPEEEENKQSENQEEDNFEPDEAQIELKEESPAQSMQMEEEEDAEQQQEEQKEEEEEQEREGEKEQNMGNQEGAQEMNDTKQQGQFKEGQEEQVLEQTQVDNKQEDFKEMEVGEMEMEEFREDIEIHEHADSEMEQNDREEMNFERTEKSQIKTQTLNTRKNNKEQEKPKPMHKKREELIKPQNRVQLEGAEEHEREELQDDLEGPIKRENQSMPHRDEALVQTMENFYKKDYVERAIVQNDFSHLLKESSLFIQKESNKLCELIKSVLEQKQMSDLKGDFRTGKKLNMKRVIPYIASNYRKDKIWLRKTTPDEKDYKIMISVDNSLSMKEKNVGKLAIFSLMILTKALQKAQVGEVLVSKIENGMRLINQSHIGSHTDNNVLDQFDFGYSDENSMDFSISSFIRDSWRKVFKNSDKKNICFIISDGRMNCNVVRNTLMDEDIRDVVYFFVILDHPDWDKSIMNYKVTETRMEEGELKIEIKSFLSNFPFEHFVVLKDVNQLCATIMKILLEYFEKYG